MKGKYLLLGSNLGDRLENINLALRFIHERVGRVISQSSIYLTSSWGIAGQPDYYNQAIQVDTLLEPANLLNAILEIELNMGRRREQKWESRIIDIDILFYDDRVVREENLEIPHPRIPERKFTLVPLAEIAADQIHPVTGLSIGEMLALNSDHGKTERLSRDPLKDLPR